jgi:hypothetical protein
VDSRPCRSSSSECPLRVSKHRDGSVPGTVKDRQGPSWPSAPSLQSRVLSSSRLSSLVHFESKKMDDMGSVRRRWSVSGRGPGGSIGRCNAFSEGGRPMGLDRILLLVFGSWLRCVRVEISKPAPAVWASIPGPGIGSYAKRSWLIAAMDSVPFPRSPNWVFHRQGSALGGVVPCWPR